MASHPNGAPPLRFRLEPGGAEVLARPQIAIIAGYTGRDRAVIDEHIQELEKLGVAPPPSVPTFYRVPPQLLTQGRSLITTERATSGEAEAALLVHDGEVFVTVGSDHTDRAAERLDVALSKRGCDKMLGSSLWRLDEVVDRWDSLGLRSWIGTDASELYQEGGLGSLLPPRELLRAIPWRREPESFVLFCGTVPTVAGMQLSPRFKAHLCDPLTESLLELDYAVETIDHVRAPADDDAPLGPARGGESHAAAR
ncbi:MAG: DUF2848 family protein [Solirubrobacteraceae bacterium]|jgi:hypothetical protein